LIAPLVFTLLIFVLQQADYAKQSKSNPHPTPATLQGVNPCQGRRPGDPCITLMYYPEAVQNGINYTKIMEKFSILNAPRIGRTLNFNGALTDSKVTPSSPLDIVSVPNADFVYDYAITNPNMTLWAVGFSQSGPATPINIQYQVRTTLD
jgi:hypothetical protein